MSRATTTHHIESRNATQPTGIQYIPDHLKTQKVIEAAIINDGTVTEMGQGQIACKEWKSVGH